MSIKSYLLLPSKIFHGNFDPNNLLKHVCSVEYFKENFSLRLSTRFEQKLAENREKIMIMYKKTFPHL